MRCSPPGTGHSALERLRDVRPALLAFLLTLTHWISDLFMNIKTFAVNAFSQNTYLVYQNGRALLIDAGFEHASEFNQLVDFLREKKLQLKAVLLTHAHIDHVLGLHRVLSRYPLPVYLSHADLWLWENVEMQGNFFGMPLQKFDFTPEPLPANDAITLHGFEIKTLFTPGHSPDHLSLYFPDAGLVVAGDALFQGGIGRTDLYKGNLELLIRSIREKLYTLPDKTLVYPGHGPRTMIVHEKKFNAFVKASS